MSMTFRKPMSMKNMMAAILGHVVLNAGVRSLCSPTAAANVIPEPTIRRIQRPSGRKNSFKQGKKYRTGGYSVDELREIRARNGVGRPPRSMPAPYKNRA